MKPRIFLRTFTSWIDILVGISCCPVFLNIFALVYVFAPFRHFIHPLALQLVDFFSCVLGQSTSLVCTIPLCMSPLSLSPPNHSRSFESLVDRDSPRWPYCACNCEACTNVTQNAARFRGRWHDSCLCCGRACAIGLLEYSVSRVLPYLSTG